MPPAGSAGLNPAPIRQVVPPGAQDDARWSGVPPRVIGTTRSSAGRE